MFEIHAGLDRNEFDDYFSGAKTGVGLVVTEGYQVVPKVPLSTLRQTWSRFSPPQSIAYVSLQFNEENSSVKITRSQADKPIEVHLLRSWVEDA